MISNIKELIKVVDLPTRQKLFFYELCKIGAVSFDLDNPVHKNAFTQLMQTVLDSFKQDISNESEVVKMQIHNKRMLDYLIIRQLAMNATKL